jgi:hypothetical protein
MRTLAYTGRYAAAAPFSNGEISVFGIEFARFAKLHALPAEFRDVPTALRHLDRGSRLFVSTLQTGEIACKQAAAALPENVTQRGFAHIERQPQEANHIEAESPEREYVIHLRPITHEAKAPPVPLTPK